MNRENTVRRAGGFVIQLMPFAAEEVISRLEDNIRGIRSVTAVLEEQDTPEHLLEAALKGFDMQVTDKEEVSFYCSCSRDRFERGLMLLGKDELESIISENRPIDLTCQFCGKTYRFTPGELTALSRD